MAKADDQETGHGEHDAQGRNARVDAATISQAPGDRHPTSTIRAIASPAVA
jgi:hypothetical protein